MDTVVGLTAISVGLLIGLGALGTAIGVHLEPQSALVFWVVVFWKVQLASQK